jgi:hypothetical protein
MKFLLQALLAIALMCSASQATVIFAYADDWDECTPDSVYVHWEKWAGQWITGEACGVIEYMPGNPDFYSFTWCSWMEGCEDLPDHAQFTALTIVLENGTSQWTDIELYSWSHADPDCDNGGMPLELPEGTFDDCSEMVSVDPWVQPVTIQLEQNYPNPFNPQTSIVFHLDRPHEVTLIVYNLMGIKVATLASGLMSTGEHQFIFDGGALSSGTYFYTLITDDVRVTKKMMLIK